MNKQLDITKYPGFDFNQALTVLGRLENWHTAEKQRKVFDIPINRIAVYMYNESRYDRFKARLEKGETLPTVDLIRYLIGDFTYYIPNTEWHGILAAHNMERTTVRSAIAGTYVVDVGRYSFRPMGMWWDTQADGLLILSTNYGDLTENVIHILLELGVKDYRPANTPMNDDRLRAMLSIRSGL